MTSKPGRPLGRPRSRASLVGHPGTSAGEGWACFPPPPGPPSSTNGALVRWPIDADAPWKSHGRLRRTARTELSTAFSTELGKPANGCRFSTASTGRRRSFAGRSLVLSLPNGRNIQSTEAGSGDTINPSTQSGQVQAGVVCTVIAPSLIPRKSGDQIKTDRAQDHLERRGAGRGGEVGVVSVSIPNRAAYGRSP